MLRFILSILFILVGSMSAFADMWIANNNMQGEITPNKQYFVSVKCRPLMNVREYMKRLNGRAIYKNFPRFPINRAKKLSHFVIFSDNNGLSVNNGVFQNAGLTSSTGAIMIPIIAEDFSSNDQSSINLNSTCNHSFFLHGKDGHYALPVFSVSSSGKITSVVAATLTFAEKVLGATSQIIRNKPLDADLTNDVASVGDILESIEAYHTALSGRTVNSKPIRLGVGSLQIRTHATRVTITVQEYDSYLKAPAHVPFTSKRSVFLKDINIPDISLASSTLNMEELKKFQQACRDFNLSLEKTGLTSEEDRAFLLGIALDKHSPDELNSIRCFKESNLAKFQLDKKVNRWLKKLTSKTVTFDKPQLDLYIQEYGDEVPEEFVVDLLKSTINSLPKQKKPIINFLNYYSPFVKDSSNQENNIFFANKLKESFEDDVYFQDSANLIGGFQINGSITEVLQKIAKKGFKRYNCYFQRSPDHEKKLGEVLFNEAQFALLMHKADAVTYENKDAKILSPEGAVVLRGYFSPNTNKIQLFETTTASAIPFFEEHSTCKALWDRSSQSAG